ncbi:MULTISPECIES: type IV pilus biogenesis protein PilM [unclassified Pseudomonas]|uniref:type IV pilus biogenesis protein PilM n=1 Tax=unclassified Pseudomonas TaxID=196821 RepID=UPI001297A113|nr:MULTISPECIES: type IV pilus biogenesis protein PilM [unclassified Pseudomonas]MQT41840.1 type IV pilus biogenesis protein PilM [Pseudomonas sp. FSL R10-0765]MQT53292.1 type IV pilus biogenesis protein PilM [Pseudomonas sp. FSL R10-2398]MQU02714.1 type IV pilus biogenesis protein PilM [Pseudomonas sp. FSL R10-2245]MQU13966.1 type IV pilus biogenesis protein PilM [Pseudomonas sp. FSL R10-2189]MQU38957.1 type IV pilus biogenesis protein PilM [Pseudomonas sp. FSL R10-2172]
MTMHWVVITILLMATGLFIDAQQQAQRTSERAALDSLSRNMLVYRAAVAEFAKSNPGFNGVPDDASFRLPPWFIKPDGVASYLEAGTAYTYVHGANPPGLPSALVDLTQSIAIGVNRTGVLISPSMGSTGISVPAAIPEGAVVAVN